MHGDDAHSLTSTAQLKPAKPAAHTHEYAKTASTHVDPFTQGYDAHSLTSTSQWLPAKPFPHVHEYCTAHAAAEHLPSEHVAPFIHGDEEHSTIGVHFLPPLAVS
jgi:hypothetical protein